MWDLRAVEAEHPPSPPAHIFSGESSVSASQRQLKGRPFQSDTRADSVALENLRFMPPPHLPTQHLSKEEHLDLDYLYDLVNTKFSIPLAG